MPDKHGPSDDGGANRDVLRDMGYEKQDISLPAIVRSIVALFAFIGFSAALALALYFILVPRGGERRQSFPLTTVRRLPPDPRIQAHPQLDLKQFLAQEDQMLTSYGWVDPKAGVARIPVDRAEDLVLQRGLPVRPGVPRGAAPGGSPLVGTESNGGAMPEQPAPGGGQAVPAPAEATPAPLGTPSPTGGRMGHAPVPTTAGQ